MKLGDISTKILFGAPLGISSFVTANMSGRCSIPVDRFGPLGLNSHEFSMAFDIDGRCEVVVTQYV